MALQTSGAISFSDINTELGNSSTATLDIESAGEDFGLDQNAANWSDSSSGLGMDEFYGQDYSGGGSYGGNNGPSSCIAYGTLIEMSDGSFKSIEDIEVGEQIVSYEISGMSLEEEAWINWFARHNIFGQKTISTVISNTLGTHDVYYYINNNLKITIEHPILMKKGDTITWEAVKYLGVGNSILNSNLEWVEVTSIERIVALTPVADLAVEEVDNYFANGVLVHNTQQELEEKID